MKNKYQKVTCHFFEMTKLCGQRIDSWLPEAGDGVEGLCGYNSVDSEVAPECVTFNDTLLPCVVAHLFYGVFC